MTNKEHWMRSYYSKRAPRKVRGSHLVAYFGLKEAINSVLCGSPLNIRDSFGRTPLSYAANEGHMETVKLLLMEDSIKINSKNYIGQTELWAAAGSGHEEVVKLLLAADGIDVNLKDKYGRKALFVAAKSGQEEVVKLLLAADDIDINSARILMDGQH